MTTGGPAARRTYIDWARGVAVLLMIGAHATDAWTRPGDRDSIAFSRMIVLGGFAAPLFLWLAGLAAALSAARFSSRDKGSHEAVRMICRRGLEIFILAFLFRLQAFIVSPGSHPISIFRVDILNIMGPAIVGAGLIWALGATTTARAFWFGAVTVAIALITPVIRDWPGVDALPLMLQWYVRPAGDLTTFTLFPWTGFVFAGAACGVILAGTWDRHGEWRIQAAFATAGIALVLLGQYLSTRPSIFTGAQFWTTSPTWFAMRIGILMLGVAALYAVSLAADRSDIAFRSLERLGRNSLFVYWIHVELVYGYASWPLRQHLPVWGVYFAWAVFSILMYQAVVLRDRTAEKWRERRRAGSAPQTAAA